MNDDTSKDIVEEVFSRSMKEDDRVSALFANHKNPPEVIVEKEDNGFSGSGESAKGANQESKNTTTKRDSGNRVRIFLIAGLAVVVFGFFAGGYILEWTTASTKTIRQVRPVSRPDTGSTLAEQPVENVESEPVVAEVETNFPAVEWEPVISWSGLLNEISATMPRTVQICVIESGDGSEMLLEGRALSSDAVRSFVDSLGGNRQIGSAELTSTGIGELGSEGLLTFSISCRLVSEAKTAGSVDGDGSSLFSSVEAEEFFGNIEPVLEDTGCEMKSFLVSLEDGGFGDEKTDGHIVKRHAVLMLAGGYQNILKAVEKLQDRCQGVWFDSVSIKEGIGTGGLECSIGISIYAAESAD